MNADKKIDPRLRFAPSTHLCLALIAASLSAQTPVGPDSAADLLERFSRPSIPEERFRCRVSPLGPQLNFTLHSGIGYILQFPLTEFNGASGRVEVFVRAAPRSAAASPLYFTWRHEVPAVPADREKAAAAVASGVEQWLPLAPANYRIDLVATDDRNRVCRAAWDSNIPPPPAPPRIRPFRRVTLMVSSGVEHPLSGPAPADTSRSLLDSASAVLAWLPAQTVRLVGFNLASEQELFRSAAFVPDEFHKMANALQAVPAAPIDYHLLRKFAAPAGFLADLITRELGEAPPADVVIFLGRPENSGPLADLDGLRAAGKTGPKFLYLPLVRQPTRLFPGQPRQLCETGVGLVPSPEGMINDPHACRISMPPRTWLQTDAIGYAMQTLHGRMMIVHTPGELAHALAEIARVR